MLRLDMYIFRLDKAFIVLFLFLHSSTANAAGDVSPTLNRGDFGPFSRSLNVKPHGYRLLDNGNRGTPSKYLERFEVRSGDCHFNRGYNDCDKDRERSELSEQGNRSPRGTTAWYGWDFYLGNEWPDIWPTKTVIGQFHQWRSHPVWMFLHYKGNLVLDDHSGGPSKQKIVLVPEDELKGKWHRIEVQAKWEKDQSGFFKVWVNGKLKFEMRGQTMTADLIYFKFGVYRAFLSRYQNASGNSVVPTQTALFANVKKAQSREGLR